MKKKFLFFPLLLLVLGSCTPRVDPTTTDPTSSDPTSSDPTSSDPTSSDPTSSDPTSSDPTSSDPTSSDPTSSDPTSSDPTDTGSDTSSDTSSDPDEKAEIDPTELNDAVGFDVYSLLPPIYSEDYEVSDEASAAYPIDVYVDLYDWTGDDVIAYDGELALLFELGGNFDDYEIQENLYILVKPYLDVAYLNIYSFPESTEPVEKDEIDPTELNDAVGFDVYSLLPKIYSNDYEVIDDSSDKYPIDVFVELYDWTVGDVDDYDEAMSYLLYYVGSGNYQILENLYIYVDYYGGAYINIYSIAEAGEKEEIGSSYIDQLNAHFGRDVYSLLPPIYSNDPQVYRWTDPEVIDVGVICWDWDDDDANAYFTELGSYFPTSWDANLKAFAVEENLFVGLGIVNTHYYYVAVFSFVEGFEPVEKLEIDAETIAELNAYFDVDVYSLLPKIYSNDTLVYDWSEPGIIDVGVICWDWDYDDAVAYVNALDALLDYDNYEEAYVLDDNHYAYVGRLTSGAYLVDVYCYGEAPEKLEIDAQTIAELNDAVGFDVYSIIPDVYSNDYEFYDWADDDYPIDAYLFLDDWTEDDYLDYVDALEALGFEYELGYGYVLGDNLFLMISDTGFGAVINIYLDPNYSPLLQSEVWPADAINDFFGEDIGSLVPSFETETIFIYAARGEGENAELSIMTDCTDPDKVDDYIASLVDAGWAVDDSLADWGFYEAVDPGEDIYLFMYFGSGIISWSFSFN
jgi:hypothetical protein